MEAFNFVKSEFHPKERAIEWKKRDGTGKRALWLIKNNLTGIGFYQASAPVCVRRDKSRVIVEKFLGSINSVSFWRVLLVAG